MVTKKLALIVAIVAIGGAIYYFESIKVSPVSPNGAAQEITTQETAKNRAGVITEKEKKYERAKEISSPDGFVNTPGITIQELIGQKVILVDFWTYSCINCQRTQPYLNAWYQKYRDQGLEIVGIHTPEFEFEKKYENVARETKEAGIQYPVILDNDYSTWTAYKNRYWPRKYLIDIDGFIVYDHIGEGGYEETEQKIQAALAERATILGEEMAVSRDIAKPENAERVDSSRKISPEIYFGAARNLYLGNGVPQTPGSRHFEEPANIIPDVLYLVGDWNIGDEFAENKTAGAKIIFRYRSEKVFMVASGPDPVRIRVFKDGVFVRALTVQASQLYRLIENEPYGEHILEILIEDSGLRAFTFTFG